MEHSWWTDDACSCQKVSILAHVSRLARIDLLVELSRVLLALSDVWIYRLTELEPENLLLASTV
jgi:hypothetical protein